MPDTRAVFTFEIYYAGEFHVISADTACAAVEEFFRIVPRPGGETGNADALRWIALVRRLDSGQEFDRYCVERFSNFRGSVVWSVVRVVG